MQKITPHLWFDKEAKEAANFYLTAFPDSKIKNITKLNETPSGSVDIVTMDILGYEFQFISAGPLFKFTKAISFHAVCHTPQEVDDIWKTLSEGGNILMELGSYPFSERYGWVEDKYGVSWQVICIGEAAVPQRITPVLMFVENVCGKAEEAVNFYTSVFKKSKVGDAAKYVVGEEPDVPGTIKYMPFTIENQNFGVMDSARNHGFSFNEAISFIVHCESQEEIDYYWEKLSAVPEAEQCGWLKDKYGVSWQIVPNDMGELFAKGTPEQIANITKTFLTMKKFDIEELRKAGNI